MKAWGQGVVIACGLAVVSGCASYPSGVATAGNQQSWRHTGATVTYLPSEQNNALANATPGQQINLGATPWGNKTFLTVTKRYFAASGKPCMAAVIQAQSSPPERVNVCDYSKGTWGATKALTMGEQRRSDQ